MTLVLFLEVRNIWDMLALNLLRTISNNRWLQDFFEQIIFYSLLFIITRDLRQFKGLL